MDLPLVLHPGAGGASLTVVATAPHGALFAQLRPLLERACDPREGLLSPGPREWRIEGVTVSEDDLVGLPPLLDGAELTWVEARRAGDAADPSSADAAHAAEAGGTPRVAAPGGVEVRVVSGPDAGLRRQLPPGEHVIGRGPTAAVRLTDASASRRHAALVVRRDALTLVDLGSSNGTLIDGVALRGREVAVQVGASLTVGASTLTLRAADSTARPTAIAAGHAPALSAPGDGTLALNRSPRVAVEAEAPVIHLPTPPQLGEAPRFSLLLLLLPLVMSGAAAFLLRSPLYLAFGLLGPMMSLAQYVTDRRRHREGGVAEAAAHAAAIDRLAGRVGWLAEQERAHRSAACPDLAELSARCAERGPSVWRRSPGDPDWLHVRLGVGTVPATFSVQEPSGEQHHPPLHAAPVIRGLAQIGVLGVAGEPTVMAGLVRAVLVQVLAWHGPRHVRIWLLAQDRAALTDWSWVGWAPHVRSPDGPRWAQAAALGPASHVGAVVTELTALLDHRLESLSARGAAAPTSGGGARRVAGPRPGAVDHDTTHVVLLAGARRLREEPGVARLLTEGPSVGIVVVATEIHVEDLPTECASLLELRGGEARLDDASGTTVLVADACSSARAETIARSLAPLRDATPGGEQTLPAVVHLTDVESDPFDPAAIATRWRAHPAVTALPLGLGTGGVVEVDLRRDGPHALVGGTTGAGKSELLRAMVAGLALRNRPDRLTFVLIDYKGGSAFDACAELPHVTGLVTDLDADATRRALAGLEAELKSREARLRQAGAADLDAYGALCDAGGRDREGARLTHLARLVVVVDEYRALADELPDFVAGLVRLAALGRSLGLHLVLATQRPAGIVTPEMRANIALRIALRVRDVADSMDVVETGEAAGISPRRPGRAVIRASGAGPVHVQTTYLGSHGEGGDTTLELRALPPDLVDAPLEALPLIAAGADAGPAAVPAAEPSEVTDPGSPPHLNDLQRLAAATRGAATRLGIEVPPPPWLPPLPRHVAVAEVARAATDPHETPGSPATRGADLLEETHPRSGCPSPTARAAQQPVFLVDDPARQVRSARGWDPRSGHLAVVGRSGSGRTTVLRTLVAATAARHCPSRLAVYVVDASGELAALTAFPHVGGYLRLDEEGALRRLAAGCREITRLGASDGQHRLVVIDGWDQVRGVLERLEHGAGVDDLAQAVRAGASAGFSLLASGERSLLTGPLAASMSDRVVLDLADPTDAYLAGLDVTSGRRPPGRARLADGLDAQVATLAPAAPAGPPGPDVRRRHSESESRALTALAAASRAAHPGCPGPTWRVASLPAFVDRAALDAPGAGYRGEGGPAVAFGLDEAGDVARLVLDGRGVLIAGPRGSGRTTLLDTLDAGLRAGGTPVVRCDGRSRAGRSSSSPTPRLVPGDERELRRLLAERPETVVLVDDVEGVAETALEHVLQAHADAPTAGSVVVAGAIGELVGAFRGLAGLLRRSAYGVLLSPGPRGPELFGSPLPGGEPALAGRGFLVDDHVVRAVQVAGQRRPDSTTATMAPTATIPTATPSNG